MVIVSFGKLRTSLVSWLFLDHARLGVGVGLAAPVPLPAPTSLQAISYQPSAVSQMTADGHLLVFPKLLDRFHHCLQILGLGLVDGGASHDDVTATFGALLDKLLDLVFDLLDGANV